IVPGSTLTYGSSFMWVTVNPRASINAPMDAAARPLPIEETTPPVTITYLVRRLIALLLLYWSPTGGAEPSLNYGLADVFVSPWRSIRGTPRALRRFARRRAGAW